MSEQVAKVGGGIEIAYEAFGDPADPTLMLVMGLGVQMLGWDDELCATLVERGFHVVRFDNRDVGLSTKTRRRAPNVTRAMVRPPRDPAYTLREMADDACGLLDCLEVESAHVMGASMGGMIAQTMAIRHPERVRSLVSIMSTTGSRRVGQAKLAMFPILLRPRPRDRAGNIERTVETFRAIGSPGFAFDEERIRSLAARSYDRCFHPAGFVHQLVAIIASGDRTPALRGVRTPTLVIHGDSDPLVRPSGGRATARAIPDARLMTIEGMGHDMPREVWPRIAEAVAANAARAAEPERAASG